MGLVAVALEVERRALLHFPLVEVAVVVGVRRAVVAVGA